ncbi:MAG: sugar phosphate isomerase/epimerase [Proteobacteria bacterium]|nr:sugar phosphate isomerase/epimerase [Pseudomonadota bacterium]
MVSTGQMFTMLEVWFTHPEAAVRRKAVEEFKGIIDVASEFGADINVSRVRGHIHEDDAYADGIRKLTDCLEPICKHAAGYGLDILLEQMNRYETNYMHSVSQVGDYIESSGISNLKIHADLFHMNIEDACMEESLEKYKDLLGYIHFADSNRLAPGQGHLDFPDVLKTLDAIGYSGWIGIEVLTEPDAYTAAKQSIDYLKDISKPRYRP